jgi:rubrerythrin
MKPEFILKLKEQFKAEQMAYSGYKELKNMADDIYLEEALEEVMYDEFLHAKFLRCYLMKMHVYDPTQHPELEKAYNMMLEDMM